MSARLSVSGGPKQPAIRTWSAVSSGWWSRAVSLVARLRTFHPSFVAHSVLLTIILVAATALAVGFVVLEEIGHQVEQRIDRRLADGVTLFQAALNDAQSELETVGALLARDQRLVEAVRRQSPADLRARLDLPRGLQAVDD